MTRDFDPLLETSMHPGEFGEAQQVSVGWGQKETQFHGSIGKQSAQAKASGDKPAFSWDSRQPQISWRGDGQYFAVSTVGQSSGARKVRVWTREGSLHSTSECANGLEEAIAWKPSGSLIATCLRKPNKHVISFFELNGLMHGEFGLQFGTEEVIVKQLLWNNDSTVLCVWCEDLNHNADDTANTKSYVQLWTVNNYHWYLKQSLNFGAGTDKVAAVMWDPEYVYHLHIMCTGGDYLRYTWSWDTCCSTSGTGKDQTMVAVLDGNKALITPFRNMVVPPPMCAFHIEHRTCINALAFCCNSSDFAIFPCDNTMSLYRYVEPDSEKNPPPHGDVKLMATGGTGFGVKCHVPSSAVTYSLPSSSSPLFYSQYTFISDTSLLFCSPDTIEESTMLYAAQLNPDKCSVDVIETTHIPGKLTICLPILMLIWISL